MIMFPGNEESNDTILLPEYFGDTINQSSEGLANSMYSYDAYQGINIQL